MKCIAVGCTSGYQSNPDKVSFFRVPKDAEVAKLWQNACKRKDIKLNSNHVFCEKHFRPSDIERKKIFYDANGSIIAETPLLHPRLKKGAVPCIFPWTEFPENSEQITLNSNVNKTMSCDEIEKARHNVTFDQIRCNDDMYLPPLWSRTLLQHENKQALWYKKTITNCIDNRLEPVFLKELLLSDDMTIELKVFNKIVGHEFLLTDNKIKSVDQLEDIIKLFEGYHVCSGCIIENNDALLKFAYNESENLWRHVDCPLLLSGSPDLQQCNNCKNIPDSLSKRTQDISENDNNIKRIKLDKLSSANTNKINLLRGQRNIIVKEFQKQMSLIEQYKKEIEAQECVLKQMTEQTLQENLNQLNVPENLQITLKEILKASQEKNCDDKQYSEEWLLKSLLLYMKSPEEYNFVRENEILPLPCVRTVRNYLATVPSCCGFNEHFFDLCKKSLGDKVEKEKHGVLLIDKMGTCESMHVNFQTLTCPSLIDLGDEKEKATKVNEEANHDLIIMYQPLDNVSATQHAAVFASRGSIDGKTLSKIIIKVIVLLENCGLKIHAVVTDGTAQNQMFWNEMGVCGKKDNLKNYFEHPMDPDRKVFIFYNTPHLIKAVRDRLLKNDLRMNPNELPIKWGFFKQLYYIDRKKSLRRCPKLNLQHIEPNDSDKMRARLAIQVFSESVASALQFYQDKEPILRNSKSTMEFCKWINNLFVALNQKQHHKGIKLNNNDYMIIKSSINKLDEWEDFVKCGAIPEEMFLTRQTTEGFRVSLHSMIDITNYLIGKYNFPVVLSGNINQDALEVCYINITRLQNVKLFKLK